MAATSDIRATAGDGACNYETKPRAALGVVIAPARPMPLAHHMTMRLVEHHWIARESREIRLVANLIYRIGNHAGLLAFCLSDTHLHCLAEGSRAEAGELARRLEISMVRALKLASRFERARIRPVNGLDHLENAVFYLFRQSVHHRTRFDPLMEGCSLLDLLGLRRIGADPTTERLLNALPRLTLEQLRPLLRIGRSIEPTPADLIEAASAVIAEPHLRSKTARTHEARQALAHLLRDRMATAHLARALGLSRLRRPSRASEAPRDKSPDARLLTAITHFARLRASRAQEHARLLEQAAEAEPSGVFA